MPTMVEQYHPFSMPNRMVQQHKCGDKSHHVGGFQVITFFDGYATPLQCRSGLMYMSILGKPTVQDLDQYPHVLLTSPHEWDPSVLDYSHPNTHGYPSWAPDPSVRDQHDPRIDECDNIHHRTIHNLLGHAHTTEPGMALRHWVHFQGVHNLLDHLS